MGEVAPPDTRVALLCIGLLTLAVAVMALIPHKKTLTCEVGGTRVRVLKGRVRPPTATDSRWRVNGRPVNLPATATCKAAP